MMGGDWGPWIEHDGKGCPCVGMMIRAIYYHHLIGEIEPHPPFIAKGSALAWVWEVNKQYPLKGKVIRYRIRKPRGMAVIEAILADLPKEQVPA